MKTNPYVELKPTKHSRPVTYNGREFRECKNVETQEYFWQAFDKKWVTISENEVPLRVQLELINFS